ncbi:MAG TPA: helix-turn-helix domain-containing protein [Myxococcota bacterium]|nr:helix-turn-helix domain-containing protein [Myxococcota bacterium]
MARPSLAAKRRQQILDALERCLARHGLEGTSLASVAAEAGVARPVIRHYFGNRDALLAAAVRRALAAYRLDLEAALRDLPRERRLGGFLDYLFLGRFVGNADRDRLFRALFAAADDDASQRLLRESYRGFEDVCFAALRAAAPRARAAAVRGAAYAVACLAEQNADFLAIGFPRSRARAARRAAETIVRSLEEGDHV